MAGSRASATAPRLRRTTPRGGGGRRPTTGRGSAPSRGPPAARARSARRRDRHPATWSTAHPEPRSSPGSHVDALLAASRPAKTTAAAAGTRPAGSGPPGVDHVVQHPDPISIHPGAAEDVSQEPARADRRLTPSQAPIARCTPDSAASTALAPREPPLHRWTTACHVPDPRTAGTACRWPAAGSSGRRACSRAGS